MCELSVGTWIRFAIWMVIGILLRIEDYIREFYKFTFVGFAIYGAYGYRNSSEGEKYRRIAQQESEDRFKQSLI